jgi:hypothetical protein
MILIFDDDDANAEMIRDFVYDDCDTGLIPVVHEHEHGTARLLVDPSGRVVASFPDEPGLAHAFAALTAAPALLKWLWGRNVRAENQWRQLLAERDELRAENAQLWTSIHSCRAPHVDAVPRSDFADPATDEEHTR